MRLSGSLTSHAVATQSVHWLAHPGLRDAVARFLDRESQGIGQYLEHLDARAPFKIDPDLDAGRHDELP